MWSIFVLLGIEKVRIVPGITASNALDLYYMPYTHSLLGVLCWSALAYVVCQLVPSLRGRRTGLILAAAVFSHWILDLIVHRPDLTLYDSVGKMGFGLWNYRGAAFALEMAVLFGGAAMLYRAAAHRGRLVGFVIFLAALQVFGTFFFPPPPSDHAAAMTAFSLIYRVGADSMVGGVAVHGLRFKSQQNNSHSAKVSEKWNLISTH